MNAQNPATPSRLTINLDAMAQNYRLFQSMTKADVAGVLKANGYGTGAVQAFKTLRKEGCSRFFVATSDEAMELRNLDAVADIFILGGIYAGAEQDYAANNITPILNSLDEIRRWAAFAKTSGRQLPAIIHFDTAMNRLGLDEHDTGLLLKDLSFLTALNLKAIMTHFACSDEKDHQLNNAQAARFAKITAAFPNIPKSLCNSSGLFRNAGWHYDVVRPGYSLYGGNPTPEITNPMRSVVDLSVRILQTRLGKKGESAGYGASHIFEHDTQLATVAIGYADGFLRSGSNKANLYWQGQACPIVGRISMDLIIVDVGNIKGHPPQSGDWLEVLGNNQSVDTLANDCGSIGYEILTSLSRRAERIYIS